MLSSRVEECPYRNDQPQKLFSVDVKNVVNKTDLKLPDGGKLLLASHQKLQSDAIILVMLNDKLQLCRAKDVEHLDSVDSWSLLLVEHPKL